MVKTNSLYFRFTGLTFLAIFFTAILIIFSYIYINKRNFWENQTSILQEIANSLKESIKYYLPLDKKNEIKNLFKSYIDIANIENIVLIKCNNKKILISAQKINNPEDILFCKKNKIIKHKDHFHYKISFKIKIPQKNYLEDIIFKRSSNNIKEEKYCLCFILSSQKIFSQLWKPIITSIIIAIIITCILTIISIFTVNKISAPLKKVTEQINAISRGNIEEIEPELLESEIEEIKELANAFNKMVEALKNKEIEVRKEIEGYINELEKKNNELKKALKSLKESQEQLIQTEKLAGLGFISAGIAHEINNPLQVINGYCEILLAKETDQNKIKNLKRIQESVNRIKKITESLGEYTRKENNFKKVNLREVVDKAIETVKFSEKIKNIAFDINVDPNIKIIGKPTELQQVFINLFLNSVQAMEGEGKICVEAKNSKKEKLVYIYIKDTGPGIPSEHRKYIFDPFFTTKSPGEGTGLGLNIVYRIIMKHKGFIRVLDNDPGATFEIILKTV